MNRTALASLTAALMLSAAPAIAQMQQQQKGPDGGGSPQMQGAPSGQSEPGGADKAEPKAKAGKDTVQGKEPAGKGTAQTEPKGKDTKGTASQGIEPKAKASKGSAETAAEPKEKGTKGTAQKAPEPKDKATKGAAEKGSAGRAQASEQQKSTIGQTVVKEKNVNRVTNVNFSINIGTRVPRSVHLVALPASVIVIVPAYRSYHYFMSGDQLCIVDPATYEIVDVIVVSNQTALRTDSRGSATLVLTDTERGLLISEIDARDGSTMGLGALSEGADVPRGVELRVFSGSVVEKVPKLSGYKFFTVENRIAIVDPQGAKVQLLIESRR